MAAAKSIGLLALLHGVATLVHFVHNGTFLAAYPNLPEDLTTQQVYLTWITMASTGSVGYWLYRRGNWATGLAVLAAFAATGYAGLLHYARAPVSAHSVVMNGTIWLESLSASVLLFAISRDAMQRRRDAVGAGAPVPATS